jgi:hypothetical protein
MDQRSSSRHPDALSSIRSWAVGKGYEFVVWTDLESNFELETGRPFSVSAAIEHIQGLEDDGKLKAAEYVWRAPEFVDTPLRRALQEQPWFMTPN